jgi:hypothetical protein
MNEINNISFTLNSTFDGLGIYYIYNSPSCDESYLVLSDSVNIINGTAIINIEGPLLLNDIISIKFIDSKGCEVCEDFGVEVTTTTTSTTTQQPVLYYTLDSCDPEEPPYSTTIAPAGLNQIYILPVQPEPIYYIWNGVEPTSSSEIFNPSLQIVTGVFGCDNIPL